MFWVAFSILEFKTCRKHPRGRGFSKQRKISASRTQPVLRALSLEGSVCPNTSLGASTAATENAGQSQGEKVSVELPHKERGKKEIKR